MNKIPKQDEFMIVGDLNGGIGNVIIIQFYPHKLPITLFIPIYNKTNIFWKTPGNINRFLDYITTNRNINSSKILDVRTLITTWR